MNTTIFITHQSNQYKLDLPIDLGLVINYQSGDIRSVLSRLTSYSKTVTFPGTSNNNKIFKDIYQVSNDSQFNPNLKSYVRVITNGEEIFNGYLKLDQINNINGLISYECTMYSDVANLFDDLKDIKLNELDFSEYSHPYDYPTIVGSWDTFIYKNGSQTPFQFGEGYVYPHIHWGQGKVRPNRYELKFYKAALYAKTVWDKCFDTVGFTYTSNFINSDYFRSLIITPPTSGNNYTAEEIESSKTHVCLHYYADSADTETNIYYKEIFNITDLDVQKAHEFSRPKRMVWAPLDDDYSTGYYDSNNNYTTSTSLLFPNSYYTVPVSGNYYILNDCFLNHAAQFLNESCGFTASTLYPYRIKGDITYYAQLVIDRNGTLIYPSQLSTSILVEDIDISYRVNCQKFQQEPTKLTIEEDSFPLQAGDKIYLQVGYSFDKIQAWKVPATSKYDVNYKFYMANPTHIKFQLNEGSLQPGATQDFRDFLSEDKCSEYVLSIAKMFNLYFEIDKDNPKNLIIEPAEQFYNGNVRDWNYKLDRNSEVQLIPTNEFEAGKLLLTYKEDNDYYNEYYTKNADGEIYGQYEYENTTNDFADKNEINKLDIIFAPTPLTKVQTDRFLNTERLESQIFLIDDNGQYKYPTSTKMRILFYNGLVDTDQYSIVLDYFDAFTYGTVYTHTSYPYAGMLDFVDNPINGLEFGHPRFYLYNRDNVLNNTIYDKFWKNFLINAYSDSNRVLKAYFNLKESDIAQLSFRDIIYLNERYWVVNKIIDFNPIYSNLTRVELRLLLDYGTTKENIPEWEADNPYNTGSVDNNQQDYTKGYVNITNSKGNLDNIIRGLNNNTPNNSFNLVILGDENKIGTSLNSILVGQQNNINGGFNSSAIIGDNNQIGTNLENAIVIGSDFITSTATTTNSNLISNAVNATNINLVASSTNPATSYINGSPYEVFELTGFTSGATDYIFSGMTPIQIKNETYASIIEAYITGYNISNNNIYGAKLFAVFSCDSTGLNDESIIIKNNDSDINEKTTFVGDVNADIYTDGVEIYLKVSGVLGQNISWQVSYKQIIHKYVNITGLP